MTTLLINLEKIKKHNFVDDRSRAWKGDHSVTGVIDATRWVTHAETKSVIKTQLDWIGIKVYQIG